MGIRNNQIRSIIRRKTKINQKPTVSDLYQRYSRCIADETSVQLRKNNFTLATWLWLVPFNYFIHGFKLADGNKTFGNFLLMVINSVIEIESKESFLWTSLLLWLLQYFSLHSLSFFIFFMIVIDLFWMPDKFIIWLPISISFKSSWLICPDSLSSYRWNMYFILSSLSMVMKLSNDKINLLKSISPWFLSSSNENNFWYSTSSYTPNTRHKSG